MSNAIWLRFAVAIAIVAGLTDRAPAQVGADFPLPPITNCEASDCLWLTVALSNGGVAASLFSLSDSDEQQRLPLTIPWSAIFGPNPDSGPPVSVGMLDADGTLSDVLYLDITDGNLHFWSKEDDGAPPPITPATTVLETGSPQLLAGPFDITAGQIGVWVQSSVESIPEPGTCVLLLTGVFMGALRYGAKRKLASAGST